MTAEGAAQPAVTIVPGATIVTARALHRLAAGIAHDVARVAAREVGMHLSDRGGTLALSVTVPMAESAGHDVNLVERGEELRRRLIEGMRELAGREVGTVDIRYSGVRRRSEKRVR